MSSNSLHSHLHSQRLPWAFSLLALAVLAWHPTPSRAVEENKGAWECRSGGSGGWDCSWTGTGQPPEPKAKPQAEAPAPGGVTTAPIAESPTPSPIDAGQTGNAPAEKKGLGVSPLVEPEPAGNKPIAAGEPEFQPDIKPQDVKVEQAAKAEAPAATTESEKKKPGVGGRLKNWLGFGGEKKAAEPAAEPKPAPAVESPKPAAQVNTAAASAPPTSLSTDFPTEHKKPQPSAKEIASDLGVMDSSPPGAKPKAEAASEPAKPVSEGQGEKKTSFFSKVGGWFSLGSDKEKKAAEGGQK